MRRRLWSGGVVLGGILLAALGAAFLASPGRSAPPVSAQRTLPSGFPGGPYFAIVCGFSHRNNDDAIVFSGRPGKSHNHTYIGNRAVDASSTPSSLLGGGTTCEADADSSTYWFPTLFIGSEPVHPLTAIVYYVKRTSQAVMPHPAGLKMVAGNAEARSRQPKGIVAWSCGGVGLRPRYYTIRSCDPDQLLQLQVTFPNCWNGRALDSADHKRHMAYASRGRCPASHPVAIPTIALIVLYPPMPAHAQVSSGRLGAHADFMNGWDQEAIAKLVAGFN
ncbi:MAG: DUF1996 domain-containing protein [Gaiellaceae bacterium]